jgi:hypothetical protein
MRIELVITGILVVIVCSCKEKKKNPPAILEGKKIDVSSLYKKRSNDLVEALYEEIVNQSAELQELENQLAELKKQWPDSSEAFKRFNEKNAGYYTAAEQDLATITDSALKKKMRAIIAESRKNYTDSIAPWTKLDSLASKRAATLNDLHTLLKLVKTLPLIEDFQKNNNPSAEPGSTVISHYDELIQKLDSLSKIANSDSAKKAMVDH